LRVGYQRLIHRIERAKTELEPAGRSFYLFVLFLESFDGAKIGVGLFLAGELGS